MRALSYPFSLYKSTDMTNCALLIVYVRYFNKFGLQEESFFCHPLPIHSTIKTKKKIFKTLNGFIQELYIDRGYCCEIYTDGARLPPLSGETGGIVCPHCCMKALYHQQLIKFSEAHIHKF